MNLIFATHNRHKLEEVKSILGNKYEIAGLTAMNFHEEILETGTTFEENAVLKAKAIFEKLHIPCFSDDRGLEVEALGNAPGVFSARYSGEPTNHERNIDKLLQALDNHQNRKARFRTVICYIDINGIEHFFSGIVNGHIIHERRGAKGFGYDPVFIPDGYEKTFAEMQPEEKNNISHRASAMEEFTKFLGK